MLAMVGLNMLEFILTGYSCLCMWSMVFRFCAVFVGFGIALLSVSPVVSRGDKECRQ